MSSLTLPPAYRLAGAVFLISLLLISRKRPGSLLLGAVLYFLSLSGVLIADTVAVLQNEPITIPDYLITMIVAVLLIGGAIVADYLVMHPYSLLRSAGVKIIESDDFQSENDEDTTVEGGES